jgi:arylsulfatase A-like enzyme/Flp pilus assembly protein TadD
VVLISVDTLRSDRLPVYGYDGVETPAIDRLRADSVLFEQAWAHYPMTFPSHASLFTGQLPTENGIRDNSGYRLAEGYAPYLPRLLKEAGYATGAFVSSFVLRGALGLAQGFDRYDDRTPEQEAAHHWGPERRGRDTLAAARPWLEEVAGRPFFLFFHLFEPHLPHAPPEELRERWGESYEGEIAAVDAVVGELIEILRELGIYDDALIFFLSDHGEGLYDHGARGHGVFLYREAIQVPLLLKLPGNAHAGASVAAPAQLIDVLPTITERLGLPTPEGLGGLPLVRLLEEVPSLRPVFAETQYPRLHYGWSDLSSIVYGRFHYIEAPRPELYDLEADPAETEDVLAQHQDVYASLRDQVAAYRQPLQPPTVVEDPETARQLAALGYAAGSGPVPEGPLPDPKDEMSFMTEMEERAQSLVEAEDLEGAIQVLHELLRHNPRATDGWQLLACVLERTERFNAALVAWQRVLEFTRGDAQAAVRAGKVMVRLGKLEEARRQAEIVAARDPDLTGALFTEIALAEGDLSRAIELLREAVAKGEAKADLRRRVAMASSRQGRHGVALRLLGELAAEEPTPVVRNALAIALVAAGRIQEADGILRQLLAADPDDSVARETTGLLALRRGRLGEARQHLERAVALDGEAANAWNLLGVARFQSQDAAGALAAWRRAVELDATLLDALYNLAFTAARLGQRDEARERLRQYLAAAPADRLAPEIAEARALLAQLGGT